MSSPAELLAMKHAQAAESPVIQNEIASVNAENPASTEITDIDESTTAATSVEPTSSDESSGIATEVKKSSKKKINMNDDIAFPSLGSSAGASGPLSWGPSSTPASSGWAKSANIPTKTFKPAVKSSSTQLTFIIDADHQQNLVKTEIFKIFSKVKNTYGVTIESTLSSTTNKRTFLLSGPTVNIQKAKRDVIKQLTKPVKIEFGVPSKLRSTIIGSQGKTLKPIIESTGVRVDIARPSDDDSQNASLLTEDEELFGKLLTVTLEGDIEGCEDAKAKILSIVNEHTKTLNVRIPVEPKLKPFVADEIRKLDISSDIEIVIPEVTSKASNILVSGPRETVIDVRNNIKTMLTSLDGRIVVEDKSVPKAVHQFLDASKILEKHNVVVEVPSEDSTSSIVRFIGLKENIPKAISFGKELASDYLVDSLDLSKSHGGNYMHAKNLTAFFIYSKYLDSLSTEFDIQVKGPSYKSLADDQIKSAIISFICSKEKKDVLKQIRKEVVDSVNKITPNFVKVVTDIESFLFGKLNNTVAIEKNVAIVPLGSLAGFGNKLLLIVQQSEDEFLPSSEEINERLDAVDKSLDDLRQLSKQLVAETIQVDAKDQKHLEGNSLKVLLNKYEPNTIEIKLHQNSEGPSENEIYLRGYKTETQKAIGDIGQIIDDVKNYEIASKYNITVELPTKFLSRFIGQKGAALNQLRDEFDVKIDVMDDGEDNKNENTGIKLTGLKSNVDECGKKISQLNKRWVDEKTVILDIDQKYHRKMIGPSGLYVNRLQDKYNVVIKFPFEDSKGKKNEVIIRGPSRGVAKVEEELTQLLQYEKENGFKEIFKVSTEVLPRVIGKSGETIKDISADTGVEINTISTKEQEKETGFAEFELVGSKKAITEAKAKISEISERVLNFTSVSIDVDPKWYRNLIGPGGLTKREIILKAGGSEEDRDFRRLLQFPARGSESHDIVCAGDKRIVEKIVEQVNEIIHDLENVIVEKVSVPKKKHRLVIGSGGSVRRSIEDEFKVRVNVPKVDSESEDIEIKGSPANVEKAKAKVLDLTK